MAVYPSIYTDVGIDQCMLSLYNRRRCSISSSIDNGVFVALRRNTCNCNIMAGKDPSANDERVACNINRSMSYRISIYQPRDPSDGKVKV
jgi:hypothetical protein